MTHEELMQRARTLRAEGHSPKEIARALKVRPAEAAELVRAIGRERTQDATEPELRGCWVSPGWSHGLTVDGHADWADVETSPGTPAATGLVGVLVARQQRPGQVSICGYLVDTHCLGVKDALGPRPMKPHRLPEFVRLYFAAFGGDFLAVPLELAQHLVLGAVDYARELGFEPHPDFEAARGPLGAWCGPSAISFGRDGRPMFVSGIADDVPGILGTLEASVGRGGFDFIAAVGDERELPARRAA